ncbi:MAG: hypothetical protein Q8P67_04685, partial [archaeon]|nr:hypothetical protein [archaeon]
EERRKRRMILKPFLGGGGNRKLKGEMPVIEVDKGGREGHNIKKKRKKNTRNPSDLRLFFCCKGQEGYLRKHGVYKR